MDHKLAIVIVPRDRKDPVQASRELLERFQNVPLDGASGHFEPKFRYKRVGGWFDGLVNGDVGQERWSTVLRMLLDGTATNAESPFPGFRPDTGLDIERRIEADNTLALHDIWPLAPCSIIVTPTGDWAAHPNPDHLDKLMFSATGEPVEEDAAWAGVKRALFWEHRGAQAVAWDLSWHFIGTSVEGKQFHKAPMARAWGARRHLSATSPESWAARIASARWGAAAQRTKSEAKELLDDRAALDRWTGEGGTPSGSSRAIARDEPRHAERQDELLKRQTVARL